MTFFFFLLCLCSVKSDGVEEGDNCTKGGLPGVCTNIGKCLAAQQDIENRREPQICNFIGVDPIVCCVLPVTTTTTTTTSTASNRPNGMCILPPYPKNGNYNSNVLNSEPGEAYDIIAINVTCRHGYIVNGSRSLLCQDGWWSQSMPNCVPSCRLKPDPSIEYDCIISDGTVNTRACEEYEPIGTVVSPRCQTRHYSPTPLDLMHCVNGLWDYVAKCIPVECRLWPDPSVEYNCIVSEGRVNGTRACEEYEPLGTVVSPRCRTPRYQSPTPLSVMHCVNGSWDYVATCNRDCGTVIEDDSLVDGNSARRGEVPWHAGIYSQTEAPFKLVCGGSLISASITITAAHCFRGRLQGSYPENDFVVAVGKLYRVWDHPGDAGYVQHSYITKIHVPESFHGSAANVQDDIAVVATYSFDLKPHVWPVCVNFSPFFETQHLQPGNKGKIAGWGLTIEDGEPTQILKIFGMPYVGPETCISESTADFREYITSDTFCAAGDNDVSIPLCKGDGGEGLVFSVQQEITHYYLRGVLSTVPNDSTNLCDTKSYKTFTQVTRRIDFIREFQGYA